MKSAAHQPPNTPPVIIDGLWIKQMYVPMADITVPQHAHEHEHASLLAVGEVEMFCDGKSHGIYNAPTIIRIPAKKMHNFHARSPTVVIWCIHNLDHCDENGTLIHQENHIVTEKD